MTSRLLFLPALVIAMLPGLACAQMAQVAPAPSSANPMTTPPSVAQPGIKPGLVLPMAPAAIPDAATAPDMVLPQDDSLGATQLRESTHIKAMIDLEKLRASLEDTQHNRLLARKKFTEDLEKDSDTGKGGGANKDPKAEAPAPVVVVPPEPKSYATSYYDFNGQSFARLVFKGAQFVVSPGTALPDGAKVKSISPTRVVLIEHGRKVTVPYLGGGLGSGE